MFSGEAAGRNLRKFRMLTKKTPNMSEFYLINEAISAKF